jgi:hypothetical protein
MDDAAGGFGERLKHCFADLPDPRVAGRCDHRLLDVIGVALLAVMSGAEDWPDIEQFGKAREQWLKTFLELPGGIPSHDTFRRVFGLLERNHFAASLFRWTQALIYQSDHPGFIGAAIGACRLEQEFPDGKKIETALPASSIVVFDEKGKVKKALP